MRTNFRGSLNDIFFRKYTKDRDIDFIDLYDTYGEVFLDFLQDWTEDGFLNWGYIAEYFEIPEEVYIKFSTQFKSYGYSMEKMRIRK